jgi:hypothetical protein
MLMRRLSGRVLAGAAVVSAGGAIFACVHNDSSLFIRNVLQQPMQMQGMCAPLAPSSMDTFISSGVLDVALRTQYDAAFLVGNQLVPQSNPQQLREETARVTVRGAVVRITDTDGNQLRTYTVTTSATIDPATTGGEPSFEPVFATILDTATVNASPDVQTLKMNGLGGAGSARFLTFTRFFGATLGGTAVESDEFEFPIDVCYGCLIGFTNAGSGPTPNCGGMAPSSAPVIPCIVGQDQGVPCYACLGESPACFGVAADAGTTD